MAMSTTASFDIDPELLAAFAYAAESLQPQGAVEFEPLPHQIPPTPPWLLWMLFGGRGSGKTAAAAKYVHDHVHGPPCLPGVPGGHWLSIVAPTLGDAVTSCVTGPSGLRLHEPGVKVVNRPGGLVCTWPNGAEAKLFGSNSPDDVERFRAGGNRCMVWAEELAAWRYLDESWQQIRYGLRVGPRPHAIASTTPRSRKLIKELIKDEKVVVTHGMTSQNPYLNDDIRNMLYEDYSGTRMGRQELAGELLEDVENALWTGEMIEQNRFSDEKHLPPMYRRAVAVDPAASENGDEHGIMVGGVSRGFDFPGILWPDLDHGFILEDCSVRGSPNVWAKRAIRAYKDHECDLIVCEVNNGGDMVVNTIRSIDATIPVKPVWASRGKQRRAEPVSSLYAQGKVHHVGMFPELEDQMTEWDSVDPDPAWSPDRMDALVWLMTELMLGGGQVSQKKMKDKRLKNRR